MRFFYSCRVTREITQRLSVDILDTLFKQRGVKDTYNFSGYSLGLGYKQIIEGGLYGFAEANYASYGSKTLIDTNGNLKPTTMNFLVGVGYKF